MTLFEMGDIQFAAESPVDEDHRRWTVVVVDDEPDVHAVTALALGQFRFEGMSMRLLHAYSSVEAIELMRREPDAAVLLLDVVMETEHAGLDVARAVREDLKNNKVRIVLRTGQPGKAPEAEVIARYEINDYREKTDLTSLRLQTVMYTCLRGYRDILVIERSRDGLEKVIEATSTIFRRQSFSRFTEGVLEQLSSLVGAHADSLYAEVSGVAAMGRPFDLTVIAGAGQFADGPGKKLDSLLSEEAIELVNQCLRTSQTYLADGRFASSSIGEGGDQKVIFVEGLRPNDEIDAHIIELFGRNVGICFENIALRETIEETQREMVYRLGGAVESRSKETANHVKRVAEISQMIGAAAGMTERQAEIFKHASPMHDVGKIGIPDHILNKPGALDPDEWEIMKGHPLIGYELLRDSSMEILRVGSMISLEHHEKWDGSGYPYGKSGEDIGLHGRITAIIDVYDAVRSRRCYKEAWSMDRVLDLLRKGAGKHFDPALLDLFLERLDAVNQIADRYPD